MSKIKITISADGEVVMDAQGFKGDACKAATKPYEQAFAGAEVQSRDKREEVELTNKVGVSA